MYAYFASLIHRRSHTIVDRHFDVIFGAQILIRQRECVVVFLKSHPEFDTYRASTAKDIHIHRLSRPLNAVIVLNFNSQSRTPEKKPQQTKENIQSKQQ